MLQGPAGAVTAFADRLATQRGVRHAHLHLVPGQVSNDHHQHGEEKSKHAHFHA